MEKKIPLKKSFEVLGLALTEGGLIEIFQLEKSSRISESVAGDRIALSIIPWQSLNLQELKKLGFFPNHRVVVEGKCHRERVQSALSVTYAG